MNRPLMKFSTTNPTGDTPGMEQVRLDVLKAAVNNDSPNDQPAVAPPPPTQLHLTPIAAPVPPLSNTPLINKNIRLPADLVDFIDYTYTKERRMRKQDAYTEALEAYFRPLMSSQKA